MTVSSPLSRVVHLTHEAVSGYPFPFKVFKAGELAVDLVDDSFRVIPLELLADYAVSGLGLDQGGTVSLTPAGREKAGTGLSLVILRRMEFTQETDYRPHDVFPAETHERALDILTMICQELREMVGRAMIAPPNVDKPIQYADLAALLRDAEAAEAAARAAAEMAVDAAEMAVDLAERAEAAYAKIKRAWASAEGVPHTEPAAAIYTPATGNLHFKIPAGEPGPPGSAPAIDVIDGGRAYQTHLFTIDGGTAIQNTGA